MRRALLQFGRERVNAFNTFSRERERERERRERERERREERESC